MATTFVKTRFLGIRKGNANRMVKGLGNTCVEATQLTVAGGGESSAVVPAEPVAGRSDGRGAALVSREAGCLQRSEALLVGQSVGLSRHHMSAPGHD